ncbi:hypothetical protein F7725_016244 [Dissostichus mawsoni]|uniref:Uncharacterized protein n=1 Tax=Dissostichus mawsoni TaxID=36200 RepID=A0A7J5Z325_DISMA|nr:hypothetical protein F7725_016244 [Dissostichus mawsoni]
MSTIEALNQIRGLGLSKRQLDVFWTRWTEIALHVCLIMTDKAWRETPKALAVFRSLPPSALN